MNLDQILNACPHSPAPLDFSRGIDVFGGIFAHSLGLLVGASGPVE